MYMEITIYCEYTCTTGGRLLKVGQRSLCVPTKIISSEITIKRRIKPLASETKNRFAQINIYINNILNIIKDAMLPTRATFPLRVTRDNIVCPYLG